jgi:PAS domain S-box-containing protein
MATNDRFPTHKPPKHHRSCRRILETLDGYFEVDLKGNLTFFNDAIAALSGYTRQELLGLNNRAYTSKTTAARMYRTFNKIYRTGEPAKISGHPIITKTGRKKHIELSVALIRDAAGRPAGFRGFARDVTEQKKTTQALHRSEERFRLLIEGSIQGVIIHSKLKPLFVNQAYADIFDTTIDAILAMPSVLPLYAPVEQERLLGYMHARLQDKSAPSQYTCRGKTQNGTTIWLDHRVRKVDWWGKHAIQMTVYDITKRKRAEEALKRRSMELRERVKELDCLYGISEIIENLAATDPEIFQRAVRLIPPALQYPRIACARIFIDLECYQTPNFQPTQWAFSSPIKASDQQVGRLEVCYLKKRPQCDEGYFILEERRLVDGIARRLGKVVERANAERTLKESKEKLHHLSANLLKAHENERRRIAYGLHDELGQDLALIKMQLGAIQKWIPPDLSQAAHLCDQAGEILNRVVEKARRISRGLTPTILKDLGLTAALGWLIGDFAQQADVRVNKELADINDLFDDEAQIIIYRIFQEALHNIAKHARADQVWVSVKRNRQAVAVSIRDNGIGFDRQEVARRSWPEKGLGLTTIEERARILGGPFNRFSQKGKGTRVELRIPIKRQPS